MGIYEIGPGETPPAEALRTLADYYAEWEPHSREVSDEISYNVTYHFCRLLIDLYGKDALTHNISEFDGVEVPRSLQPLISVRSMERLILTNGNRVSLEHQPRLDYIPGSVPRWDHMEEDQTPIEDRIELVKNNPVIRDHIEIPWVIQSDRLVLNFEPDQVHGWGLEFLITPNNIRAYPYGRQGQTRLANEFVNNLRPTDLAITVAELALINAQHSDAAIYSPVDSSLLYSFKERAGNRDPIPISSSIANSVEVPPEYALLDYFIRTLKRRHIIGSSDTVDNQ
jgi:hypothetical protein